MMTSSVHDLADESGSDDQQTQVQPEIQHHSSHNVNFQHSLATPSAEYMMAPNNLDVGHTMTQTSYPYLDPYYGGMITPYTGQPAIHPQLMGVLQPAMPLPTDAVVEPVYVNAKQYHGILRRRQSRAKAESENKLIKCRKPYLHESRHLHALKRARGCGGRFLNAKAEENQEKGEPSNNEAQPSTDPAENSRSENARNADRTQDVNLPDPGKRRLNDACPPSGLTV